MSLDEVLERVVDGHHAFARAMLSRLGAAVSRTMLAQHTGTAELLDELVEATDRFGPPSVSLRAFRPALPRSTPSL